MIKLEVGIRMVLTGLLWALASASILLILVMAAPKVVGGQSFAVLSDSMRGAVNTGDEVVVLKQAADQIEPGQIVAFNDPDATGRLYLHRVQRVDRNGQWIEVVTKGDANTASESWRTPIDSEVGKVVLVIPKAGHVFGRLGEPTVRMVVLGIPALIVAILLLVSIWRRPKVVTVSDV